MKEKDETPVARKPSFSVSSAQSAHSVHSGHSARSTASVGSAGSASSQHRARRSSTKDALAVETEEGWSEEELEKAKEAFATVTKEETATREEAFAYLRQMEMTEDEANEMWGHEGGVKRSLEVVMKGREYPMTRGQFAAAYALAMVSVEKGDEA